jgi:hypothetical protein
MQIFCGALYGIQIPYNLLELMHARKKAGRIRYFGSFAALAVSGCSALFPGGRRLRIVAGRPRTRCTIRRRSGSPVRRRSPGPFLFRRTRRWRFQESRRRALRKLATESFPYTQYARRDRLRQAKGTPPVRIQAIITPKNSPVSPERNLFRRFFRRRSSNE